MALLVLVLRSLLELAAKNILTSTHFRRIEEMVLRMYYLYEKPPKKYR